MSRISGVGTPAKSTHNENTISALIIQYAMMLRVWDYVGLVELNELRLFLKLVVEESSESQWVGGDACAPGLNGPESGFIADADSGKKLPESAHRLQS